MPEPPRTAGGHRSYGSSHERRLVFIRRCRELGFSIEEIRVLLGLVDGGDYTCGEVKSVTDRHLDDVRRKIADLRDLERTLKKIGEACAGGQVPDCPIIDSRFIAAENQARKFLAADARPNRTERMWERARAREFLRFGELP